MKTKNVFLLTAVMVMIASFSTSCKKDENKRAQMVCPYFETENFQIGYDLKEKDVKGNNIWQSTYDSLIFRRIDNADPTNIVVLIKKGRIENAYQDEFLFSYSAAQAEVAKVGKKLPSYHDIYFSLCGINAGWYILNPPSTGIYIYKIEENPGGTTYDASSLHLADLCWGIWGDSGVDHSLIYYCELNGYTGNTMSYSMGITNSDMVDLLGHDYVYGNILMSVRLSVVPKEI